MSGSPRLGAALAALVVIGAAAPATADSCTSPIRLEGYQEVPPISTRGQGRFELQRRGNTLAYTLTYSDLTGTPTQAHIHFGTHHVNGGIGHWLCQTAGFAGPAGTPVCPSPNGTVRGFLTVAGVVGPSVQGIAAGELDELLKAICRGVAYVNVHSTVYPAGQIRGQTDD